MISASMRVDYDLKKVTRSHEKAMTKGLEMSMFVWETGTKILITTENHVVTGRYRASVNRNRSDGMQHGSESQFSKGGDGIHRKVSYKEFTGGSNVEYALDLEKRFGLFARALDKERERMIKLFTQTYIKNL